MAESDHFYEIQEESPYQTPNGHLAAEEESPYQAPSSHLAAEEESPFQAPSSHLAAEEESPFQAPNSHLAAEEESYQTPNSHLSALEEERINPELLRAIVNGDLMLFESILQRERAPTDMESTPERNGGNNGLRGVAYGENTALHVVAGAMEKSSQIPIFKTFLFVVLVVTASNWKMRLLLIFLLCCYIIIHFVIKVVNEHFPQIQLTIYEKAKKTRWLKWFLAFCKRRMYKEIAESIYRWDTTLLNACNYAEETPLHCAAIAGNIHMVSLLVEFAREQGREDPEKLKRVLRAKNKVGETALHEAARSGYSGIVKELLRADETVARLEESGAYENLACLEDINGISPLYLAAFAGCHDVVQQLIAATPSYAGPDKQNALHAAVMGQNETITRAILDQDQPLAAKTDKARNTPLHYAALIGNTYAVKELLLKDTGPVYRKNLSGSFPVHLAAEAGNVKVIKELLSMCPDVSELLDKEERNFLHVAVEKKKTVVIMWACQQGINVKMINAKDKDGNTPLHLAVISSESEIVALLSRNKRVNPNIRNKVGLTPLDISTSLLNHQFTYSANPQSTIHGDLLRRGAIQSPYQPNPSTIVGNPVEMDNGASVYDPSRRERKEMYLNGVRVAVEKESTKYEKESTKYENMSKSLTTGAALIASATFVAIFTVSGLGNQGDNTGDYDTLDYRSIMHPTNIFIAFVVADVAAFFCAILSTIGLLYSSLSNIQLRRRKLYFQMSTRLLYGAIIFFILTFALGVCFALASSKINTITTVRVFFTIFPDDIFLISVNVIIILINMACPNFVSRYLLHTRIYKYARKVLVKLSNCWIRIGSRSVPDVRI